VSAMVEQAGRGLTSVEARARLERYGPNRLVAQDRAARLKQALGLVLDPMALMLLAASGIYVALGDTRDGMVMLVALLPVMGVDVFLEARSRAALKKLARSVAPRARVIRDGGEILVDTASLVPGDLLALREGEFVQADGVVRACANLAIDESSLTGESEPQLKRASAAGDGGTAPEQSLFYAGSTVVAGQGEGEVVTTGRATRFGEIARLVGAADASQTPLQKRVGRLVTKLAIAAGFVAVAIVLLGLYRGLSWGQALLGGISVAMSAAPEEFPLVFTLYLSVGAWRLSKQGVLVRRLASVETLGSTTVVCTDKTGTLTRGQFVLDRVIALGASERELIEAAVLACEAPPSDPLEKAIVAYASAHGVDAGRLATDWRLVRDHDFDPTGKHMSHVWSSAVAPARLLVVAKGALEGILEHAAGGVTARAEIEAAHGQLASQGIRVLAVASRSTDQPRGSSRADDERDLTVLGLLGFLDPVRAEVPGAVRECQAAGVRIKIVTGDHALTAHAIADSAGVQHREDGIVTGDQLARVPPDERRRLIGAASILARITPAQKHMVVQTLRESGEIVAMTGDGINDAPALRQADIGVSMGLRGTDVARASADLVLLDDNFASIVAAIREGRKIFLDIQRAFLYLLGFHIPIVGLAVLPPLLGMPLLLMPVHLVWLELIVHPVSALLFQGEPPPPDLMQRPPRDPRAPMLARKAALASAASGALLTGAVLAVYAWGLGGDTGAARGLALATLIVGYQLLALLERAPSLRRVRDLLPSTARSWVVWAASAASLPVLMYLPATAALMKISALSPAGWLTASVAAFIALGWRIVLAWRRPAAA